MAESIVQVTEGTGKKLHTNSRTVGTNTVEDEYVLQGEPFLASYAVTMNATGVSIAVAADHVIQIMAGATFNVYIRRLLVWQTVAATTAAIDEFQLLYLTTAGTGGTALTVARLDVGQDSAAGATAMSLPTAKGAESVRIWVGTAQIVQTPGAGYGSTQLFDIDFERLRIKSPRLAAGTTNGIALKNVTSRPAAKISVVAYIQEANY